MAGNPTAEQLGGTLQNNTEWPADAFRFVMVDSAGVIGNKVIITNGTDDVAVDWDGHYNALAVTDGRMVYDVDDNGIAANQIPQTTNDLNYGYHNTHGYWTRFLTDTDDGSIAAGQVPQLVANLNYYYEAKSGVWERWQGESGSLWTTVVGLYTGSFDPITDDTADAMKCMPVDAAGTYLAVSTSAKQLPDDHNVTVSNMIPAVETGLATSALQLPDGHNVIVTSAPTTAVTGTFWQTTQPVSGTVTATPSGTQDVDITANTIGLGLDATLTDKSQFTKLTDGTDTVGIHNEMIQVVSDGHLMSEGLIANHKPWLKIGYNPLVMDTEETLWSAGGDYVFSKGEAQLEVVSSSAGDEDTGTIIHSGTSTGGSTTTLIDTGADFTAGTAVTVFDTIILDKSGTTPEWGFVTGVTATTLTVVGFSSGGTGDARDYNILDYSADTGVQAVFCKYLDDEFVGHDEIIILDGNAAVATIGTDYYRINGFRVIAAGALGYAVGNITIQGLAGGTVYGHITLGYTYARQAVFTVPSGKTLYVNSFNAAWSSPNDSKVQTARVILRANMEHRNHFNMKHMFFPYIEVMVTNEDINVRNDIPLQIPEKTDVIVSIISTSAAGEGPATCVMRGWIKS